MIEDSSGVQSSQSGERRTLLRRMGVAMVGAALIGPRLAQAQGRAGPVAPPSVITQPPRTFGPNGAPTTYFTDPDVLTVDPSFGGFQVNSAIQRLWTGGLWCEGPAWSSVGKFLVWSDIPNNRQMRWLDDDGRVTVFRAPSTTATATPSTSRSPVFVRAPQSTRGALRARRLGDDHRGLFNGKRLNSPNDVVRLGRQLLVHRPAVRRAVLRGHGRRCRGPDQRDRRVERRRASRRSSAASSASFRRGLPGRQERHAGRGHHEDTVPDPNGLCFSPDYKKMYVASTGQGPGDTGPGGKGDMSRADLERRQQADQSALLRPHGRRRQLRPRWLARRHLRQPLVLQQCWPERRLQRRHVWDPRASCSGASGCPKSSATSPSAARSATASSWPAARRCTRCTPVRKALRRAEAPRGIAVRRCHE